MLKGFEKETAELTDYELLTLMPQIIAGLRHHIGKEMAISNRRICLAMTNHGYKLSEPRLRKIVNHIRVRGLLPCIVATSSGYYVSRDRQELEDYIDSLLSREQAIGAVREALTRQMDDAFGGEPAAMRN